MQYKFMLVSLVVLNGLAEQAHAAKFDCIGQQSSKDLVWAYWCQVESDSEPANHVAAIIVGGPSLGGKAIGRNKFYGANDPRGGTGLAQGY
jgi:hypothetical protein